MSTLSRRGLFAFLAAPFAAAAGATEVAAATLRPTHTTVKPAPKLAKIMPVVTLAAPRHLITPVKVGNVGDPVQAQISALQGAVNALQANENSLWTYALNVFAFANSVRGFAKTTNDSLNTHIHMTFDEGAAVWFESSFPQW